MDDGPPGPIPRPPPCMPGGSPGGGDGGCWGIPPDIPCGPGENVPPLGDAPLGLGVGGRPPVPAMYASSGALGADGGVRAGSEALAPSTVGGLEVALTGFPGMVAGTAVIIVPPGPGT